MSPWRVRWATCSINVLADRAGRYRRVALGLGLAPIPLTVMGLSELGAGGSDHVGQLLGLAHLLLAVACVWLAADLVASGTLAASGYRVRTSWAALIGALALVAVLRPSAPTIVPGSDLVGAVGLAVLVGGFAVLALADVTSDGLASLAGRGLLAFGSVLLGSTSVIAAAHHGPASAVYAVGLAALGVQLLLVGFFEVRLLRRGVALLRLARR